MNEHTCRTCGETKSEEFFYNHNRLDCKKCYSKRVMERERRKKTSPLPDSDKIHTPPVQPPPQTKTCTKCGTTKTLDEFPIKKNNRRRSECLICYREYQRIWAQEHKHIKRDPMELMNEVAMLTHDNAALNKEILALKARQETELKVVEEKFKDEIETLRFDLQEADQKVKVLTASLPSKSPTDAPTLDIEERRKVALSIFPSIMGKSKSVQDAVTDSLYAAEMLLVAYESMIDNAEVADE
jgi:hypothetical protein